MEVKAVEEIYADCLSAGSHLRERYESKICVESPGIFLVEKVEQMKSNGGT